MQDKAGTPAQNMETIIVIITYAFRSFQLSPGVNNLHTSYILKIGEKERERERERQREREKQH